MSHHFDTPTVREDPRLNLCDMYLFAGSPDTTVMAMTVNPAANAESSTPFRDEAVYAFRFDTDGDRSEDVSFKVSFADYENSQRFDLIRADGAPDGLDGTVIVSADLRTNAEERRRVFAHLPVWYATPSPAMRPRSRGSRRPSPLTGMSQMCSSIMSTSFTTAP